MPGDTAPEEERAGAVAEAGPGSCPAFRKGKETDRQWETSSLPLELVVSSQIKRLCCSPLVALTTSLSPCTQNSIRGAWQVLLNVISVESCRFSIMSENWYDVQSWRIYLKATFEYVEPWFGRSAKHTRDTACCAYRAAVVLLCRERRRRRDWTAS